jgi:peptidoglycan/xylan/chitin deacetylase (PgdA/CDA1 family)
MKAYALYYRFRNWIPRWMQIEARRYLARFGRFVYSRRWPIDSLAAGRPEGFTGWPENKGFALVLRHDVESRVGLAQCADVAKLEKAYGMRSAFFFVPEDYVLDPGFRAAIAGAGGEVGVHGLKHDGKLYLSRSVFRQKAKRINEYLSEWQSVGFASPSSHHRFDWLHDLNIMYDASSFDTDPFEPQPDGVRSIFPMVIRSADHIRSFIELPYTLPQDFTLFVILQEESTRIWRKKLDWVARNGGMAMVNTHPDYMHFPGRANCTYSYPSAFYEELLAYVERVHRGAYWMALPREVAGFWRGLNGKPKAGGGDS